MPRDDHRGEARSHRHKQDETRRRHGAPEGGEPEKPAQDPKGSFLDRLGQLLVTSTLGIALGSLTNAFGEKAIAVVITFMAAGLVFAAARVRQQGSRKTDLITYSRYSLLAVAFSAVALTAALPNPYTIYLAIALVVVVILLPGDLDRIFYSLTAVAMVGCGSAFAWKGASRLLAGEDYRNASFALAGLALLCGSAAISANDDDAFDKARQGGGIFLTLSGVVAAATGALPIGISVAIVGAGIAFGPKVSGITGLVGLSLGGIFAVSRGHTAVGLGALLGGLALAVAGSTKNAGINSTRANIVLRYVGSLALGAAALIVSGLGALTGSETVAGITIALLGATLCVLAAAVWLLVYREKAREWWTAFSTEEKE